MAIGQPLIFVHLQCERYDLVLKFGLKPFAVAAVLALSVGAGHASTVSLRYDGPTARPYATVTFKPGPVTPAGPRAGAVGFNMTSLTSSGNVIDTFVAWCLDIEHWLAAKGQAKSYTITPFGQERVQSVFDANFKDVDVADKFDAAGFQVALWNAFYDTDWKADDGAFAIESATGVISSANAYLAAASAYRGTRAWNLTFLQSNTQNQSLVTATPVPVPAAAGLMLLALGGLAAAGRRRRTA
jgi:hypothetical protein